MSSSTSTPTPNSPAAPSTPIRPQRSQLRLSMAAHSSLPPPSSYQEPPTTPPMPSTSLTPSTVSSFAPQTPATPDTPAPAPPSPSRANSRKSVMSVRRKPVPAPLSLEDEHELEMASMEILDRGDASMGSGNPITRASSSLGHDFPSSVSEDSHCTVITLSEPPRYILPVDAPPPFTTAPDSLMRSPTRAYRLDTTFGSTVTVHEDLPRYAEETQTEPKTLARGLWRWGFLCPFLWFLGMCILWIPLRPFEEEEDAEKAQKLEEMIVILRETEVKYAKRCAFAFGIFVALIIGTVCIAVAVTQALKH